MIKKGRLSLSEAKIAFPLKCNMDSIFMANFEQKIVFGKITENAFDPLNYVTISAFEINKFYLVCKNIGLAFAQSKVSTDKPALFHASNETSLFYKCIIKDDAMYTQMHFESPDNNTLIEPIMFDIDNFKVFMYAFQNSLLVSISNNVSESAIYHYFLTLEKEMLESFATNKSVLWSIC